jgi:hypothetical protein
MAVYWSAKDSTANIATYSSTSYYWARWGTVYPNTGIFESNGTIFVKDAI